LYWPFHPGLISRLLASPTWSPLWRKCIPPYPRVSLPRWSKTTLVEGTACPAKVYPKKYYLQHYAWKWDLIHIGDRSITKTWSSYRKCSIQDYIIIIFFIWFNFININGWGNLWKYINYNMSYLAFKNYKLCHIIEDITVVIKRLTKGLIACNNPQKSI